MIDTEPGSPTLAVQRFVPSKAMLTGAIPRLPDATVAGPGGNVGSITYRLPGEPTPAKDLAGGYHHTLAY